MTALDTITLASGEPGTSQAKRVFAGAVISPPFLSSYTFVLLFAAGLTGLHDILLLGATNGAFAVNARPKTGLAGRGRRAIHDSEKGPAVLVPCSHRRIALDFDSIPGEADPLDGPQCCTAALQSLPPEFHHAGVIWQLTAGAGVKSGIRVRLWFWLDREVDTKTSKLWLKPQIDSGVIDPCTLEECQPIFLGVIGGPQCQRFGLIDGEPVAVPNLSEQPSPQRGKQSRQFGNSISVSTTSTVSPRWARREIAKSLAAIRAAEGQEGTRLPAFKHHGARVLWLARAGRLPPQPVHDALWSTGEAMFGHDMARICRNVEGMMNWWGERDG